MILKMIEAGEDRVTRLASVSDDVAEIAELIEDARYALDRLETLPDARRRLEKAIEAVRPLARKLFDAAREDADAELFAELFSDEEIDAALGAC